jgi:acyl-CoA reductase-like NAD-dependent aldehyde dehydrogenase
MVAACEAARETQRRWAMTPAPRRGRVIQQIGRIVEANKEALAELVTDEIGKPYVEALGEVQEIIDTCDFFLGEGRRLYGQTVPSEMRDKQLFTYRMPVGTATIITAGNFPVAVPSWYLIPALLCGNTVVWKPAEYAAAAGHALFELFVAGGLPAGVLNLVLADGKETFAGLERSLVVLADADLALAVEGALFSGFGTAGQRCTSLGTAIVADEIHDEFLERFTEATEQAAVGDPMEDVVYGPMLDAKFAERFDGWLDLIADHHRISGSSGVGRITADNPRRGFVGDPDAGIFYHPTIAAGVTADDELYRTETFGPLVGVMRCADLEEAITLANGHGYGLSAAIYTNDPRSVFQFRERISAGMLSVNNSTSGAEAHLPFGGNGRSGNGSRLSGQWVLDQFTRWQSVNWDYAGKLQKAQMDIEDVDADLRFRLER